MGYPDHDPVAARRRGQTSGSPVSLPLDALRMVPPMLRTAGRCPPEVVTLEDNTGKSVTPGPFAEGQVFVLLLCLSRLRR